MSLLDDSAATTDVGLRPLAEDVMQRVQQAGCRISTAESCTGGLIAAALTEVEGCSHMVDGAVICYSDAAKSRLLGIPADLVEREGAVSRAVAEAMVRHVLEQSHSDLAISVTGFAGEAGPDDEAGLVFLAAGHRDGPIAHLERHYGDIGREATRAACLRDALLMLQRAMP